MNKTAVLGATIALAGLLGPFPAVASAASPTLTGPVPAAAPPAHASATTAPAAESAAACRWGPNPPTSAGAR